jgi:hydrogenase nickel incorporation protein HypA/HybF
VATKDTPLEEAVLSIEELSVVARCNDCKKEWTISNPAFTCPDCNSGSLDILSGRELDIESIELEEEDENDSA